MMRESADVLCGVREHQEQCHALLNMTYQKRAGPDGSDRPMLPAVGLQDRGHGWQYPQNQFVS